MSDYYVGEIRVMAGLLQGTPPDDWHICDGSLLAISQYQVLFSVIGTIYGGDGVTTFALPDFRGRVGVSSGQAATGSTYTIGQKIGTETVTLQPANMPQHTHPLNTTGTAAITPTFGAGVIFGNVASGSEMYVNATAPSAVTANVSPAATTIQSTGGGQAHTNMMPGQVLYYIIATNGLYPTQN